MAASGTAKISAIRSTSLTSAHFSLTQSAGMRILESKHSASSSLKVPRSQPLVRNTGSALSWASIWKASWKRVNRFLVSFVCPKFAFNLTPQV